MTVKIVHISDTHQYFPKDLPKADILIHTGDYSLLSKFAGLKQQITELNEFNDYLDSIKNNYDIILFCAGNHDWIFEREPALAENILNNAIVLNDSGYDHFGVKFYGTSSQPIFCDWAFNHNIKTRIKKYAAIPEDTDILLTHCPPEGILDLVSLAGYNSNENVGCPRLRYEVENRVKPKLHCFGHIHSQPNNIKIINETTYSNSCIMDDYYQPNGICSYVEIDV